MSIINNQYSKRAPENAGRQSLEPLCVIERHPWEPFLPENTKVLMLGSFPPQENRWSMDFFYPNFNNDMWRIIGRIFFDDKDYFTVKDSAGKPGRRFDKDRIVDFCRRHGLALYDTALEVRRLNGNASDKFLDIVTPVDIKAMLERIPECNTIISTGEKAGEIIGGTFGCEVPKPGKYTGITYSTVKDGAETERSLTFYRLPSSSRAYPLALDKKAEAYSILKDLLD